MRAITKHVGPRWGRAMAFASPFKTNHCGPIAVAHVSDAGAEGALRVAETARRARVLTARGYAIDMLHLPTLENVWLGAVGYRLLRVERLGVPGAWFPVVFCFGGRRRETMQTQTQTRVYRPGTTVRTMMRRREFRRGRWLVFTRRHVFAYVEGEPLGTFVLGARVTDMVRVEPAPEGAKRWG